MLASHLYLLYQQVHDSCGYFEHYTAISCSIFYDFNDCNTAKNVISFLVFIDQWTFQGRQLVTVVHFSLLAFHSCTSRF